MRTSTLEQVLLTRLDLVACARTIEARHSDAGCEHTRLELTRRFLTAALTLERTLRAHTRCALVNHCGTHGNSNLEDVTHQLFEELLAYAVTVRECAQRSEKVPLNIELRIREVM
jgi:hypothetical protein